MLTKQLFESLVKKDISDTTFALYENLWLTYKQFMNKAVSPELFIKILNVREIQQDNSLHQLRIYAKKQIPNLKKKIKELEFRIKDLTQTIAYLETQNSCMLQHYRCEKLKVMKELKKTKIELLRLQKAIK